MLKITITRKNGNIIIEMPLNSTESEVLEQFEELGIDPEKAKFKIERLALV